MKRSVGLILVSLLFVSVLFVSLISASVLGSWFGKTTGNVVTGNAVSASGPWIKTCEQTRHVSQNSVALCNSDELPPKNTVRSRIRSGWTWRTVYTYDCVKTTKTECSANAACSTGMTEAKSEDCEAGSSVTLENSNDFARNIYTKKAYLVVNPRLESNPAFVGQASFGEMVEVCGIYGNDILLFGACGIDSEKPVNFSISTSMETEHIYSDSNGNKINPSNPINPLIQNVPPDRFKCIPNVNSKITDYGNFTLWIQVSCLKHPSSIL